MDKSVNVIFLMSKAILYNSVAIEKSKVINLTFYKNDFIIKKNTNPFYIKKINHSNNFINK